MLNLDLEVTVKHTLKNFCTEEELGDKTPLELYKEVSQGCEDYLDLYTDTKKIIEIKVRDDGKRRKSL